MNLIAEFASCFFGRIGDAVIPRTIKAMPAETNPLIALCVGHSRFIGDRMDGGAVSVDGTTEHAYNSALAVMIAKHLESHGIKSFIVDRYQGEGYGGATRWVAAHVEQRHASCAIELHFNASSGGARGHEWLYWGHSKRSRELADKLRGSFEYAFPDLKSRGSKGKVSGDRGGEFLRLTHCPAVIAEPFFGDNPEDWSFATNSADEIAAAIAFGINAFIRP